MLKNNCLAMVIHIVIGFMTFSIFTIIDSFAVDHIIEFGDFYYNGGAILAFSSAIMLYVFSGKLLSKQETIMKNILSVISVSIIGLDLWLICFIITGGTRTGADLNWAPYIFYVAYSLPLDAAFNTEVPAIALLFAVIPSLFMWMGIQIWHKRKSQGQEISKKQSC